MAKPPPPPGRPPTSPPAWTKAAPGGGGAGMTGGCYCNSHKYTIEGRLASDHEGFNLYFVQYRLESFIIESFCITNFYVGVHQIVTALGQK